MPNAVAIWVWFCAYLNVAGWTLSAIHQLNAGGYLVALLLWFGAVFVWKQKNSAIIFPRACRKKFLCRFRKPFPRAFLILAAMAFLGGVLYAPSNYDALAYRIPRVLHWLAANHWHWIHAILERINNRSCGIEWVSAPFIAIFKTDRFLFLINIFSFLILPGLVFSLFTRLGVRRRVAWHWMWLVPTGYSFLLQAGSIGNDLFGAPFALAAIDFALRAKISRSPRDFFTSILAAAMMTSAKTSSLPLLLPWAIAIFPSLKLLFRQPLKAFVICLLAIFASALPTMYLNQKFSNDWSGAKVNRPEPVGDKTLRTIANVFIIAIQNLVPPVFPIANAWDRDVEKMIPPELNSHLHMVLVERDASEFKLPEMQMEENAGLGFGVSALLLASVVAAKFARSKKNPAYFSSWQNYLRWAPAISLLVLMTQYNLAVFCRILTPYYALLIPLLLADSRHEQLVKKSWWRTAAFAVLVIAAGLLVIQPARPLFPIMTLLEKMPNAPVRTREVYSVYHERPDAFAAVRKLLPPDLKILGMITYDDPETSLWYPFGSRRVEHVRPEDTAGDLKARGIHYVFLRKEALGQWFDTSVDDWLKKMNAQMVWKISLNIRASSGARDWYLVKLN